MKGLEGRIQAMAKAHNLLSESRWEGVSIKNLLREELDFHANGHAAIALDGMDMQLTPKSALSLSLAIHELATNAAKYGALTASGGRVAVGWRPATDGGMELTWAETGGPLVKQPKSRGFGSTLIERALSMETEGSAIVHYLRTGVVCDIFLPASAVSYSAADVQDGVSLETEVPPIPIVPNAEPLELRNPLILDSDDRHLDSRGARSTSDIASARAASRESGGEPAVRASGDRPVGLPSIL